MGYFRYVHDILVIFKGNLTNTQDVLKEFNALCTNVNITLEEEQNKLNFLGINIYKSDNILTFGICRKPAIVQFPKNVAFLMNIKLGTYPLNNADRKMKVNNTAHKKRNQKKIVQSEENPH